MAQQPTHGETPAFANRLVIETLWLGKTFDSPRYGIFKCPVGGRAVDMHTFGVPARLDQKIAHTIHDQDDKHDTIAHQPAAGAQDLTVNSDQNIPVEH